MTPEKVTVPDSQLASCFDADGIFCYGLLQEALETGPDHSTMFEPIVFEIENLQSKVSVFCAQAAEMSFNQPSELQTKQQAVLESVDVKDSLIRKMTNNSTYKRFALDGLNEFNHLRPHSIFLFLVRDCNQTELLILVEGLDDGDVTAVHTDLRAVNVVKLLVNQIWVDLADAKDKDRAPVQRMYSGHIWGNIIMTDSTSDTGPLSSKYSPKCFYQKMVNVLTRNGFTVITPDH